RNSDSFVMSFARHKHACERRTGLAGVEVATADAAAHGLVEVCIIQNDVGRLPAQFERDALDGIRGELAHPLACPRRTRERDHIYFFVRRNCFPDYRTVASHKIEYTSG